MPRTVQVLVDRAPTNIRVRKKRAGLYYPDVVLCVDQDSGVIHHHDLLHPDDGEEAVGVVAQAALAAVRQGNPSVRVIWVARGEQVAAALASRFGEADVWSGSSEDFGLWDEAYIGMDRELGSRRGILPYLWRGDITAEEVGALFTAAAHYYRMKPWQFIPDSELLEMPGPGGNRLLISVMGASGISLGLVLFDSEDDFERMQADGREANVVFATLERVADVPNTLRREAEEHGWEIADASAFPELLRWRKGEPVACSGDDLRRATAAFLALAEATSGYRESGIIDRPRG